MLASQPPGPHRSDHRVTRQSLRPLLHEASDEDATRVVGALSTQIETLGRVTVGMQLASPVRGKRRMRKEFQEDRGLTEIVNSVIPDFRFQISALWPLIVPSKTS